MGLGMLSCERNDNPEKPIRIAVASSIGPVFDRFVADSVHLNGRRMDIVRGSSGALAGQIREGAPFDLFVSADENMIKALQEDSLMRDVRRSGIRSNIVLRATGSLPRSADSAVSGKFPLIIPNPQTAPVGVRALEIIRAVRHDTLLPRLILARNAEDVITLSGIQPGAYAISTGSVAQAAGWPEAELLSLQDYGRAFVDYHFALIRGGNANAEDLRALSDLFVQAEYKGLLEDQGYFYSIDSTRAGVEGPLPRSIRPDIAGPLWISLKLALITTIILLLIGLPLAWWLRDSRSPLRLPVDMLSTLPIVLPPTVLGFYLLVLMSPAHAPGSWLRDVFGLELIFSFPGLVIGSVIFSLPFMVQALKTGMELLDHRMLDAARTLGKGRWSIFRNVVLPNIRPAILTGCVLSFAHTLGEFGVVMMLGGNVSGETRTASVAIFEAWERMDYKSATVYALSLLGMALILLSALHIWRIPKRREG